MLDDFLLFFVAAKGAGGFSLLQMLAQPVQNLQLLGEFFVSLQRFLCFVNAPVQNLDIRENQL